jgi:hypothetical protein
MSGGAQGRKSVAEWKAECVFQVVVNIVLAMDGFEIW